MGDEVRIEKCARLPYQTCQSICTRPARASQEYREVRNLHPTGPGISSPGSQEWRDVRKTFHQTHNRSIIILIGLYLTSQLSQNKFTGIGALCDFDIVFLRRIDRKWLFIHQEEVQQCHQLRPQAYFGLGVKFKQISPGITRGTTPYPGSRSSPTELS